MKRLACFLLISLCSLPAWSAKKTSIQELRDLLIGLDTAKKSDFEVATRLKEVDLSEQLTRATMDSLAKYIPGELSTQQMYVLEGRSALLSPPAADLPASPAPDAAAQKALLDKANAYIANTFSKTPQLTGLKTISRFQDGVENIRTNSGVTNNMPNSDEAWKLPNMFMRYLGTHTDEIETGAGVEKAPAVKDNTPWGINGQVSEGGLGLPLATIFQEAQDSGKLAWLRWETVNTRELAVFSFSVPKKKSRYDVRYCCFPVTSDTGRMGYEGTGANLQYGTSWKEFKTTVGFHGELFIDPTTGAIVRLNTQAELKPTDFVHQEDTRIDFGPVPVNGAIYMLPLESFIIVEVVPNGDNYAAVYSVRHTVFTATYKNYQPAEPVTTMTK